MSRQSKKVTMQMIAEELGISRVSVSKALNDQFGVGEELKESIINKAREMGYSMPKRADTGKAISDLGLIISDRFFFENEQFYSKICFHLHRLCTQKKISLHLYVIHRKEDTEHTLVNFLDQHTFQGVFLGGEIDDRFFNVLNQFDIPVMAIDFYKLHMSADAIVIDNYYAGFVATSHLIEKGHTNIGFLGNPKSTSSVSDRFYGYLKALNQNDLEYRKEWHIAENYEAGMFTHKFTLPDPLPTSFVCHCDQAAYSLMLLLRGQEVHVPDQISIIAFDNTDISQKSDPQITTIDIGKQEIAEKALEHMLWRIEHPEAEIQKVEIHTRLIERQTVKAL